MDIEKMLEGINKIFPIDENREPIHPFNQHQYLRREGFRKGVEWALKQVENNGVLDDVSNSTVKVCKVCKTKNLHYYPKTNSWTCAFC